MAHEHKHGPNCNHSHGHGHHHHHNHGHTFTDHHKHGPNCKHKHDNKSVHYSHGEHAADCGHKNHKKCNHGHDKYEELTAKDYEKRRRKRQLRQWARRGNHTLQNCIAAIWIWSLSESPLRYYYDNNMYDKILLFHGLQILSLILFLWSSLSEPGFLSSDTFPNATDKNLKKNEDEVVSLLSTAAHNGDLEANNSATLTQIDPNGETPPSFCRSCRFLRPLRAKHCYLCDRCVPRFDHHCPLIEQCVGAKNYRQFYVLCWSQLIVSGWSFLIATDCLFYSESSDRSNIGWIWRILLFLWMLYQGFMAVSLVSFHSYLVCTQQTTYEFLKPKKLRQRLDYEQENVSPAAQVTATPSQQRKRGIPGPWVLMRKMCIGMGFCLCDYPFSQGLIRNWYGFITADCLERAEYFKTEPVILIKSTPKQDSETNSKAVDIEGTKM